VLNLASETSRAWVDRALAHIDDVLLDHAHCEKKAAGAALRLLFQYPEHRAFQQPLARLAREELEHFARVLDVLEARGVAYGRQKPSAYGGQLHALLRARDPERLLDRLLVGALIEARSCERFRLLARNLGDARLAGFYRELLACEARHHGLYVELAGTIAPAAQVRARLHALALREAQVLASGPVERVRLHSPCEAAPPGAGVR